MDSDGSAGKNREPDRAFPKPDPERTAFTAEKRAAEKRAAGERHWSDLLDDALNDTFPGSDPVSITQPTGEESE
jgi:hypothetical protein